MRVQRVEIPAPFKRFGSLEITDVGPEVELVVMIGPNGSGKSSVFDAPTGPTQRNLDSLQSLRGRQLKSCWLPRRSLPRWGSMEVGARWNVGLTPSYLVGFPGGLQAGTAMVGALAIVVGSGQAELWMLYVIAFALGAGETLFDTAAQSVLPGIVQSDQLDHANGRLYAVELTANQFIGPPVAAIVAGATLAGAVAMSSGFYLTGRRRAHDGLRVIPRPTDRSSDNYPA